MGARFERDGEFHMSLEDFREYFEKLDICHLTAKGMEASESIIQGGINARQRTDVKFDKFEFNGEWVRGSTAGGCGQVNNGTSLAIASATYAQNPQVRNTMVMKLGFLLIVTSEGSVIFKLFWCT